MTMLERCSGKQGDRAVPEFDMRIRTKDFEGTMGVSVMPRSRAEASLTEHPPPSPGEPPVSSPFLPDLAYPHPLVEGPVDYTLSTLHAVLIT